MDAPLSLEISAAANGDAHSHQTCLPSSQKASHTSPKPPNLVIILSGVGHHFCGGIDISTLGNITSQTGSNDSSDRGRSGERLRREIKYLQDAISAIEKCRKPVIEAVKGACISAYLCNMLAAVAALCVQYEAEFLPNMSIVVKALQPLLKPPAAATAPAPHV